MTEVANGDRVRVVVADDHPLYREGVVRALVASGQVEVVAQAGDGRDALDAIREHRPDVALLDYKLPELDGVAVTHAVVRDGLATRVLLLSAYTESGLVYQALQTGAAGYLLKEARREQIVDGVLACSRGERARTGAGGRPRVGDPSAGHERRAGLDGARERDPEARSRTVRASPRSPGSSTWASRRSRPTCNTSTRSWVSPIVPRRSPRPCADGSSSRSLNLSWATLRADGVGTDMTETERRVAWLRLAAVPSWPSAIAAAPGRSETAFYVALGIFAGFAAGVLARLPAAGWAGIRAHVTAADIVPSRRWRCFPAAATLRPGSPSSSCRRRRI